MCTAFLVAAGWIVAGFIAGVVFGRVAREMGE